MRSDDEVVAILACEPGDYVAAEAVPGRQLALEMRRIKDRRPAVSEQGLAGRLQPRHQVELHIAVHRIMARPDRPRIKHQIGRASCRERVCQYVSISVVAVYLKKKKKRQNRRNHRKNEKTQ